MDWLTQHLDMVVPVALVLLFLFQRMFMRDEGETGPGPADSETQEEARRIQEEIRRKIIARQQGRAPEQQESPARDETSRQRPVAFPRRQEERRQTRVEREGPPTIPRPQPVPVRRFEAEAQPAARNLQDELRIQMERLEEARRAKEKAVRSSSARGVRRPAAAVKARPLARGNLRSQLLGDLATGESMKRAFILKEVVDRPIGLRDRPDVFSNWS